METKSAIEFSTMEFSHRASIYLLGVASACRATPDEALKIILEAVANRMMPSFEPVKRHEQITKTDAKAWLKAIGQDREWLAGQCFVTKPTIDGWLRSAGIIPPAKLALIQRLMMEQRWAQQSPREEVCHA